MKKAFNIVLLLLFLAGIVSCKKTIEEKELPTEFSSIGNIAESVNQFRTLVGSLNTTVGNTIGRREINWDGVPDNFASQSLPIDFFNPIGSTANLSLQRGITYESGGDFRVSATAFSEVASNFASDITAFSGTKVFANVSAAAWQVGFQVAAESTAATVNAFGVVFIGVDLSNSSYIELLNGTESLGKFYAQPHNSISNFSFVGVHFKNTVFATVKIVHGNASFKSGEKDISKGGVKDLVALDDFIYAEPRKK